MRSSWFSPRLWLNATLGWIAQAVNDMSSLGWLASLSDAKGSELGLDKKQQDKKQQEPNDQHISSEREETIVNDEVFDFLASEADHTLSLVQISTHSLSNASVHQTDKELFDEEQSFEVKSEQAEEQEASLKGYADLLLNTEDLSLDSEHEFFTDFTLDDDEIESEEAKQALKEPGKSYRNTPQAIQRIKLRDEDREKAKSRKRRKKRRAERLKKRAEIGSSTTKQNQTSTLYDELEQNMPALTSWRRPPLRSLSKWERMGQAQMSQWQRYSPSSKALLFGSWFASLDALVEVEIETKKEQREFYQLVEDHEELSQFSSTELDAWWFQLNRVDYFVTEFQFYKRLEQQDLKRVQTKPFAHQDSSPLKVNEEQVISETELMTTDTLPTPLYPSIQTFDPEVTAKTEASRFNENLVSPSLNPEMTQMSIDIHSIEEDVILKPIKRRKRTK